MRNPRKLSRLPRDMKRSDVDAWAAPGLVLLGVVALYAGTLLAGFINDDYLFLEQTRRYGLWGSLTRGGGLGSFSRPRSREAWFGFLAPMSGGEPLVFHLAQLALFVVALVLLVDMISVFGPAFVPHPGDPGQNGT